MKKKIAITGGIGSGKSTALRILKEAGYPVFSCDEIYQDILRTKDYVKEITNVFPEVVEDGGIDVAKLASIVFADNEKRNALNAIAHPKIMGALLDEMEKAENRLVFAEVPLLLEGKYQNDFDEYIVVMRPLKKRISSICARDCVCEEEVISRIQTQYNYEEEGAEENLEKAGAIVILNEGTEEDFREKIFVAIKKIS